MSNFPNWLLKKRSVKIGISKAEKRKNKIKKPKIPKDFGALKKYAEYIHSDIWDSQRKKAYKRDKYKCKKCGRSGIKLHAHHTSYKHERGSKKELNCLISLCYTCHKEFHKNNYYNSAGGFFNPNNKRKKKKKREKFISLFNNSCKP